MSTYKYSLHIKITAKAKMLWFFYIHAIYSTQKIAHIHRRFTITYILQSRLAANRCVFWLQHGSRSTVTAGLVFSQHLTTEAFQGTNEMGSVAKFSTALQLSGHFADRLSASVART